MKANEYVATKSLASDTQALRRGEVSLLSSIDRLEARFAKVEPAIQAFLPEHDRFRRLRNAAEDLESRFAAPDQRPALYGAMLGVKDIFHVDGFVTRAGTTVPPALFAGEEAPVVTRLKASGALLIGKTVTTEFAYFEPGATRNPHNLAHTPGGSSSGSAAAVASGLAQVALGTQTVGSVIRPAAYCGIVGFKPSFDRVDSAGLVRFSESADHVGFFTGTVPDMQAVAAVVIDDWRDDEVPPRLPVLGVPEGSYLRQCAALDEFEAQLRKLTGSGYTVKRFKILDDIEDIDRCHQDMIAAELAIQHEDWFARHATLYRPRTSRSHSIRSDGIPRAAVADTSASLCLSRSPAGRHVRSQNRPVGLPGGARCRANWHRRDRRSQDEHALDPRRASRTDCAGRQRRAWASARTSAGGWIRRR